MSIALVCEHGHYLFLERGSDLLVAPVKEFPTIDKDKAQDFCQNPRFSGNGCGQRRITIPDLDYLSQAFYSEHEYLR